MKCHPGANTAITRIKMHYDLMSNQEKRVADYIMLNLHDVISPPVAIIARNAGVSPATVVRFSHSIGFAGISEFKKYLKNELLSHNEAWYAVQAEDSIERIAKKTMDYNKRAIDETLVVLNNQAVEAAVKGIEKAERIVLLAEGASASSARCAYDAFSQIRVKCSLVMDPFFMVTEASQLCERDVSIGVCHSGRARNVVDAMRLAKDSGATTISIVGIVGSPITKCSDVVLYTGLADHSFHSETIAVRICELNVISVLHTAMAIRRQEILGDYRSDVSNLYELKRYQK